MHFQEILDKHGCTNARLREIFTARTAPETPAQVSMDHIEPPKTPSTNDEIRMRFESRIRSRLLDGIANNGNNNRPMQAVDMAWDSPPIQKHTIPLMLWATGKIKIEQAYDTLCKSVGETTANKFFKKSPTDGKVMALDGVRISDITIDLVKSYVTRRHAAMDSLWSQLWPLFKYDPRGTDDLSLFRADVLTQRIDIMAEDYNYRHIRSQANRYMLLYCFSCLFPRSSWDVQTSWRFKRTNTGEDDPDATESYVVREGVDFVMPHPSRIFYDASSPLPNVNTDTGPKWVGYWDVVRYGTLLSQGADYFNLNHIFVSNGWIDLAAQFSTFLSSYFDPKTLAFPNAEAADPTLWNDVDVKVGKYTSEAVDQGILLTQYFERINPKEEGIGDYNCNVWIRLTVAGDCTVIGAEFMPSIPCCYGGINVNDGRFSNQSMAMQLLAYQDQASNIITHMIQQIRASMLQLVLLDTDSLPAELAEEIKTDAKNLEWFIKPHVLTYSATKLKDAGFNDPKQAFVIISNQLSNAVDGGLKALGELLNLADRLLVLSPNEQGQPNPREVSAREVNEVSTSVQSIYSFINAGPREQTGAMKRMLFESLITNATENIRVPVEKRYTRDVIERAGFKLPDDFKPSTPVPQKAGDPPDDLMPSKTPVMGNLRNLNYDYYFDSRDGSERQVNAQGAQVITGLLQFMYKLPGVAEKLGVAGLLDAVNLVIRMSGAPWNFQFDLPVGQSDKMDAAPGQDPNQQMQQMGQALAQLGLGLQKVEHYLMAALHADPRIFGIAPGPPGAPGAGQHTALHPAHPGMEGAPAAPAPAVPSAAPAGAPAALAAAASPQEGTLAEPNPGQ